MVDPQHRVDVFAGRELHWRELGADHGGPPVVFASGLGLSMEFWEYVVELLPDRHLVLFDRPGLGGTPWPRELPTLEASVDELVALIEQVGGPVVLVAHSMAGFHAEALARLRPELLVGLVMVDASAEWPTRKPLQLGSWLPSGVRGVVAALPIDRPLGAFWRLSQYLGSYADFDFSDRRLIDVYRDQDAFAMGTAESLAYPLQAWDLDQLRATHPWPGVPTVVVTAEAGEGKWNPDQQLRYASMLHARVVLAQRSKHLILLDRPELIARAVRELGGADSAPGEAAG